MIIRREKNKHYSIISNECLKNPKISTRAKGMYAYLMTLPNDWVIQKGELYKHFAEGKDYLDKGFNELKKYGYIEQLRIKKSNGQFAGYEYVVYEIAQNTSDETISGNSDNGDEPSIDIPSTDIPSTVEPQLLKTNIEQKTKKELKTKLTSQDSSDNQDQSSDQENQLVSDSLSYFAEISNPNEIDPTEEATKDLQSLGLSNSQIKAVIRTQPIDIVEQAVIETFQAKLDRKINERASQYFYGVLNNLKLSQEE